jgi:D-glycero-D-manno-heptose 1,7-bisphosphate phosphatase
MRRPTTVFLDRDGVINRKPPEGQYVRGPSELELLPGAPEAIARLSQAGVRTVVVTNQQGVGKGLMTIGDLDRVHARLRAEVEAEGGRIDQLLVCPHLEGTCECRKPRIGLFVEARRRDGRIAFDESVMIGDSLSDMAAAEAIGAAAILVAGATDDDAGLRKVAGMAEATELLLEENR